MEKIPKEDVRIDFGNSAVIFNYYDDGLVSLENKTVRIFFGSMATLREMSKEEYVPCDMEYLGFLRLDLLGSNSYADFLQKMAYLAVKTHPDVDVVITPENSFSKSDTPREYIGYALNEGKWIQIYLP